MPSAFDSFFNIKPTNVPTQIPGLVFPCSESGCGSLIRDLYDTNPAEKEGKMKVTGQCEAGHVCVYTIPRFN